MEKKFTNENKLYRVVAVCCCVCIISAFSWFCSAVKWSAGLYYLDVKKLLTMFINILNWLPTDDQFSTFPVGFVFFQEHVFQSDVANSTYSNNPCYHLVVQFKFTSNTYLNWTESAIFFCTCRALWKKIMKPTTNVSLLI